MQCVLRLQASEVAYDRMGYKRECLAPPSGFHGDAVRVIGYPAKGHQFEHVDMYMVRADVCMLRVL